MNVLRVVLFVAVAALAVGCNEGAPRTASAEEPAPWPQTLRFGLVPSEGGTDIVERFAPLTGFLSEHLGVPVEAFSASDYIGVVTAMQNDQVDFAYFGPKSYVEASRIAGAEAIIKELNEHGEPGYESIIVVKHDSPITSLDELEGRTFGFVTPNSTSGFLVPVIGIVRETGRAPEDLFGEIVYTGSHGSAMSRVAAGDLPAAATNTHDMRAMARAGLVDESDFRAIWTSRTIPAAPFAVRGDLPEDLKAAIADAFLAFNDHAVELRAMGRAGFVRAEDSDYDIIRVLERRRAELLNRAGAGDDGP